MGYSPLLEASAKVNAVTVRALLDAKSDVNQRDKVLFIPSSYFNQVYWSHVYQLRL